MKADAHHGVRPLPNLLANDVVVERVLIAEDHAVVMWVSHVSIAVLLVLELSSRCTTRSVVLHLIGSSSSILLLLLLQKFVLCRLVSGCRIVHMLPLPLLEL